MLKLRHYRNVIGEKAIERITSKATPLENKHIVHINSTFYGGGVAEMLNSLVPLMNDVGIQTGWRLIKGSPDFFSVTKSFHNGIQGEPIRLSAIKKKIYEEIVENNAQFTHLDYHDTVIVHDPQPLPLINHYSKKQPWIWRCHIDLSNPQPDLWAYLQGFIKKYDAGIISKDSFGKHMPIDKSIIHPSIDPLSSKNHYLKEHTIAKTLKKFFIYPDKPIISQISRFDKWKDPIGVIKAFQLIKKKVNCRLVLLGSAATDDPESQEIYEDILQITKGMKDIHVINFENNILVNALQRVSSVVIQKSIKEGFGLTVAEALWKGTPVVASKAGGIPLQMRHGKTGYMTDTVEETAKYTIKLLQRPKMAERMGAAGHNLIKRNFLVTRHLEDYIDLLNFRMNAYKKGATH